MSAGRGPPAPGKPGMDLGVAAAWPGAGPFDRRVIGVGGVVFVVLMAVSGRYGFHRDELYFLACAQHLQASYVDQPAFTPLLAWVSLKLFGVSLPGLRLWPALAAWATVVVAGLTAREFGGGRRAQLLAAIAVATMPAVLGAGHLLDTTAFDILAWAGVVFITARIGPSPGIRILPGPGPGPDPAEVSGMQARRTKAEIFRAVPSGKMDAGVGWLRVQLERPGVLLLRRLAPAG